MATVGWVQAAVAVAYCLLYIYYPYVKICADLLVAALLCSAMLHTDNIHCISFLWKFLYSFSRLAMLLCTAMYRE
jgi:hypothetical protein